MMSYSSSRDQAQDLLPGVANAGITSFGEGGGRAGAAGGGGEGLAGGVQEDQILSAQRPFASLDSTPSTSEKVEPWFEGLTVYVRACLCNHGCTPPPLRAFSQC
jgi:hypothetical protein